MVCCKKVEKAKLISCPECSGGKYCSETCIEQHENHAKYCPWITRLEKLETVKRMKKEIFMVDAEKLPYKMKLELVRLVGERPMVNVQLNGSETKGLWDTGAMISLVSKTFLRENLPDVKVHSLSEFMKGSLTLTAANKSEIGVDGVVILDFGVDESQKLFQVPFLVTSQELSSPIIGYNTIEHLVRNYRKEMNLSESLCKFVDSLTSLDKAEVVVNLIEKGGEIKELTSEAKLDKNVVVYPGSCEKVKCKIKDLKFCNGGDKLVVFSPFEERCVEDELVIFESTEILKSRRKFVDIMVYNPTKQKIVLQKGAVMGQVSDAAAAYTLPIMSKVASVNEIKVDEDEGGGISEVIKNLNLENLSDTEKEEVIEMLQEESDVFSKSKNDIGHIKDFKLDIKLTDETPFGEAYRKIPGNLYQEVKNYVNDLLANGWIKQSYSPYSSPMVCVRKKCGGLRLCIDFRRLNKKTIPDMQPIPRVQDILDKLHGQAWFTTLDMSQAYHQGEMAEESRKFTAFSTPWSLYEWVRIPYGIMNAPAGFQRFINNCLAHLSDDVCIAYLDDVLIFSKTFKEHKKNVKKVLRCLREKGVKLNMPKCNFFKEEIRYLGRLVSKEGYRPDPEDVRALDKCKVPPTDVGKLRSLLGFLGYYRTYIKDFSRKVKPIYDLLQKDGRPTKNGKKQLDSRTKIVWTDECQKIVEELVEYLKSPSVIAYPNFEDPFIVHTDASQEGLGAALYQVQDGKMRIISLASRTLTPAEKNYFMHSGKLEFLALKWAVTEKFSDYLINGPDFEVVTDNNPLTYVLSTAKLHSTGLRWIAELANYRFSIRYRSGKKHVDADYLSRNIAEEFVDLKKETDKVLETEDTGILLAAATRKVEVTNVNVNLVDVGVTEKLEKIEKKDLKKEQLEDKVIGQVYNMVKDQTKVGAKEMKKLSKDVKVLMRQMAKLSIVDGVLMRKTTNFTQIVLPEKFHKLVFEELHEKLAHVGADRVLELARPRFYWPRMKASIEKYITKRCRCIISKKPNIPAVAPLKPIVTTYPFELLTMDYVELDVAKGGFKYALVCTDHFTKFTQIFATKNKKALSVADKIYNDLVLRYGFPTRFHSDQGGEFVNKLLTRLHELSGTKQSRTTPYHPQGNGATERFNRTMINMLKTLGENEKKDWSRHLSKLAFAYNVTVSRSTGFSPYYLMFGREPRLPIDSVFQIGEGEKPKMRKSHESYADDWQNSMNQAFEIVKKNKQKKGEYNKKVYDKRARGVDLEIGDRVLSRNREKGGTGKLRSFWEDTVYKVVKKDADIPVIVIKPEKGGKEKRVHRNDLLRCNLILPDPDDEQTPVSAPKSKKKSESSTILLPKVNGKVTKEVPAPARIEDEEMNKDSSDSEDDEYVLRVRENVSGETDQGEGSCADDIDGPACIPADDLDSVIEVTQEAPVIPVGDEVCDELEEPEELIIEIFDEPAVGEVIDAEDQPVTDGDVPGSVLEPDSCSEEELSNDEIGSLLLPVETNSPESSEASLGQQSHPESPDVSFHLSPPLQSPPEKLTFSFGHFGEDELNDSALSPTIPYNDSSAAVSPDSSSSTTTIVDSPESPVIRKSSRSRFPKQIMTYEELGKPSTSTPDCGNKERKKK